MKNRRECRKNRRERERTKKKGRKLAVAFISVSASVFKEQITFPDFPILVIDHKLQLIEQGQIQKDNKDIFGFMFNETLNGTQTHGLFRGIVFNYISDFPCPISKLASG